MTNARIAAVLTWVYAAAYGIPAIPVSLYLLERGSLPSFQGMFEMYGGPWWIPLYGETFVAPLAVFFVVTLVAAWAAGLLWKGSNGGAVLSLVLLPVEALFWFGFALPIPWLFGIARIVFIALAWNSLTSTDDASQAGAARTSNPVIVLAADASGAVGLLANVYLVLFYALDRPWQPGGSTTNYGTINDWLIPVQLALLLPVVVWLGQQTRASRWTAIGLAASVAGIVLQVLLMVGVLAFEVQIVLQAVSIIVLLCWTGGISGAAERHGVLSRTTTGLGRLIMWAVPVGLVVYAVGAATSAIQGEGSWAWIVGALPGALAWLAFPVWVLLVARSCSHFAMINGTERTGRSEGQSAGGGRDILVGGGERNPHVPGAGWSVEVSGRNQDSEPGEPAHGVPARLVPGRPEIQTALGVVDPEPRGLQCRPKNAAPGQIPLPLVVDVPVVLERGNHGGLHRRGNHHTRVFTHLQQPPDQLGVPGNEPGAVAGHVGTLGQGVNGEQAVE
jgi:hypothetical protein